MTIYSEKFFVYEKCSGCHGGGNFTGWRGVSPVSTTYGMYTCNKCDGKGSTKRPATLEEVMKEMERVKLLISEENK